MDIGNSFEKVLDTIIGFIPNLLGFLLILLIGYLIAKVVAGVVRKVLEKVGIDQKVQQSDANRYVDAVLPGARPSGGIARLVFWLIFVFFLVTAIGALQIPTATNFMNQVSGLPAERDRRDPHLRRGSACVRRRRRRGRQGHGRHDHRQGRGGRGAGSDHGDRDVHDPRAAADRPGDRSDRVRSCDVRDRPRTRPRLRSRVVATWRHGSWRMPTARPGRTPTRSRRTWHRAATAPRGLIPPSRRDPAPTTKRALATAPPTTATGLLGPEIR